MQQPGGHKDVPTQLHPVLTQNVQPFFQVILFVSMRGQGAGDEVCALPTLPGAEESAALVLLDRGLDLVAPTAHADHPLDRAFGCLPRRPAARERAPRNGRVHWRCVSLCCQHICGPWAIACVQGLQPSSCSITGCLSALNRRFGGPAVSARANNRPGHIVLQVMRCGGPARCGMWSFWAPSSRRSRAKPRGGGSIRGSAGRP